MNKNIAFLNSIRYQVSSIKTVLCLVSCVLCLVCYSQNETKEFNGVIKYALSYEIEAGTSNLQPPASSLQSVIAQQPKELEMKFNGNKTRTDIDEGGTTIAIIKNGDNKTIITLMDMSVLNKKVMIKTSIKTQDISIKTQIKLLEETKDIAGYKCKKGELITKDKDGKEAIDEFYYTDELGSGEYNFDSPYRDVKGILMQYVKKEDKIKIIATATSINKESISEKEFTIPNGYEEMTIEQLTKLLSN